MTTPVIEVRRESLEGACLPDLLGVQARERPDATAVVCGDRRLTYRELADGATALGGHLRELGVGPDACVGLFVEPSLDLMVGAWGVLIAGGAYLPLSPEYPEERLRYMIEDAGVRVIVAQDELVARLTELAPAGTRIVTPGAVPADETRNAARTPPRPDDLAYVIYTSGSTGKPKGVMIEHRSVVSQLRWLRTRYGLSPGTTIVQKTPMSFDAAQWEILAPGCGAMVVMGPPGVYRDAERLVEVIRTHDVTALQCVPTLLTALLDTEELHRCTSLTQVFTGGEVLSKTLATNFIEALPWCELINLYGPTECTINSSAFTVDPAAVGEGPNAISIGAPVDDTDYHILDVSGAPVAVGEIGELHIGGVQVARGYLHRPELTAERFVRNPFGEGRLFRTGDLAYWNADGTVQFVGRADNQVKLRGFRVELDEIKLAIETHDWVKHAAVIVRNDPRTGFQNLIACVELNPKEAALMDQGSHGAHHQSKESRLQVRAQLSNPGVRDAIEIGGKPVVDLPGKTATGRQRGLAFTRKTYRFYEGGEIGRADILRLLAGRAEGASSPGESAPGEPSRGLGTLRLDELGEILRYFGPHLSAERLLPKYAYASPGALYATQLYLEIDGIGGLDPGFYYHHPVDHRLVLVGRAAGGPAPRVRLHFAGRRRAIEPVYTNNIREVLEIEAGHMVGLFEKVLPEYGLDIADVDYDPAVRDHLDCAGDDDYLGTFELVPYAGPRPEEVDVYVQAHPGKVPDLRAGQYAYENGRLRLIAEDLILKKQVIAINQQVYDRACIGVSVISRNRKEWLRYIDLGRKLQQLSMNDLNLGFMSSGYSSRTGDDLPSARRIDGILRSLGRATGPSYFFLGGRVSDEQRLSEGMKEDLVHMQGPAEMIRDDLINFLPDYMIPNKVVVLDRLPFTANGKIDVTALAASDATNVDNADQPYVAPRTTTERRIAELWKKAMKRETVSVRDDFFASGGNSLIAVGLINKINREFCGSLPLQVLFECPTVEKLARRLDGPGSDTCSRLVPLQREGAGPPVYCWPGLGGYPMNLRLLAGETGTARPFYGVQAYGVNAGEVPYATIAEMAAEDVGAIRRLQPTGPYTLWGYSFGARVAFETAWQLEQAGERVEHLFLIAPGSPKVHLADGAAGAREASWDNPAYVTILFSVFAGTITGPLLERCLAEAKDEESFAAFVHRAFPDLDAGLVRRIMGVVGRTFEFGYTFHELARRRIQAPITVFRASGDDYSFLEGSSGYSATAPVVVDLEADHYALLREAGIGELVAAIRDRLDTHPKEITMPHVSIKHFPVPLTEEQHAELLASVTKAMTSAFGCDEGAVSIILEPVAEELWNEKVYIPEIVNQKDKLGKVPNYGSLAN